MSEVFSKDGTRSFGSLPASELEPVAHRDGVWLQDRAWNLMVINSVITTDRMSLESLREVFRERVIEADGGRYDRFKRMVVRSGSRFFWRDDPDFDISRHIFTVEEEGLETREGLQDYIARNASLPLPDDRPLWQLHLIPDFGDGGSAIVTRVHHVLGDGVSMMPIIFSLMDFGDEDPATAMKRQQVATRGTAGNLLLVFLKAALVGPFLLASRALSWPDRSPLHGPELTGTKRVAWTRPIDLERIKTIKNRLGATVNDVLLTAVSGAFRRYVERHPGATKLGRLRVSMPVNIRPPTEEPKLENKFAAVIFDLPVDIADRKERLRVTRARMNALKRSVEPMVYYGAVNVLLKILPKAVSHWLVDFYARKCTAVLSNVPGPQDVLSVAGSTVRGMLFWVPQRANIGLGISILSFSGQVRVGVFSDTGVLEDPGDLVREVEEEVDALDQLM